MNEPQVFPDDPYQDSDSEFSRTARVESHQLKIALEKENWFDRLREMVSDWCSSLLVKECRQALKSRQFVLTYFLLLIVVAFWINYVIIMDGTDRKAPDLGRSILTGLFVIMGLPLGLVIPFNTFRSLSREYETGTIQLISITTMKPWQIIGGKLGSGILQMMLYLSILAPCIFMTYLLRGISLDYIFWMLGFGVLGSLFLTIIGLFLGGIVKTKVLTSILSVIFLLALGGLFIGWVNFVSETAEYGSPVDDSTEMSYLFFVTFVMFGGSMAVLLLTAASSQISFAASNQATPIRWVLLAQQALFLGVLVPVVMGGDFFPRQHGLLMIPMFAGHFWLAIGFLINGESPHLSRRVLRSSPRSLLGRSWGALLMPGPGRGMLFSYALLLSIVPTFVLLRVLEPFLFGWTESAFAFQPRQPVPPTWDELIQISQLLLTVFLYPMFYLALNFLLMRWVLHRSKSPLNPGSGPMASLFVGIILIVFSMLISAGLHNYFHPSSAAKEQNPLWGMYNWYWFFGQVFNSNGDDYFWFLWKLFVMLPAILVILWAIFVAVRELQLKPLPIPERVRLDQQPIKPQLPAGETLDDIFGPLAGAQDIEVSSS